MTPEEIKQAIGEFQQIYKEERGVELSIEEATIKAQGVLQLFDCLTQGTEKEVE